MSEETPGDNPGGTFGEELPALVSPAESQQRRGRSRWIIISAIALVCGLITYFSLVSIRSSSPSHSTTGWNASDQAQATADCVSRAIRTVPTAGSVVGKDRVTTFCTCLIHLFEQQGTAAQYFVALKWDDHPVGKKPPHPFGFNLTRNPRPVPNPNGTP